MPRTPFTAPTAAGPLAGWVDGTGTEVLLLHGGPGMGGEYLDPVADELLGGPYRVALFQQRGLAPSTLDGPFTIEQALADVEAVLDALGWRRAVVVGHSWGGHLALHAAVGLSGRLDRVLAVDPLGGVGDGGAAEFDAELRRRVPDHLRARADELTARDVAGEAGAEEQLELLDILWPSYFADPTSAPPCPSMRIGVEASAGLWPDLEAHLPALEEALPGVTVPVGILAGAGSPMPPQTATVETARRIPGAWAALEPGAGHFPWVERPGCVRAALDRLCGAAGSAGH
jgi:pimeloyl-ACP methyl ester carboxylesterase